MTVASLGAVTDSGRRALKVLASERSTTVGAVLGDLHRVTRRRPPVVLGARRESRYQVRDVRLRSVAWPRTSALARTPRVVGDRGHARVIEEVAMEVVGSPAEPGSSAATTCVRC